jgi:hypothetical protein
VLPMKPPIVYVQAKAMMSRRASAGIWGDATHNDFTTGVSRAKRSSGRVGITRECSW